MMDDRLQRTDAEYEAWVLAGLAGESA